MQTAAYVRLQLRGLPGALVAYIGFGLPAFVLMVVLSSLYASARDLAWTPWLLGGLQIVVVAIIANATYTFGRGTLKTFMDLLIAGASATLFWLGISPFYVIAGSGIIGAMFPSDKTREEPGETEEMRPFNVNCVLALVVLLLRGLTGLYFANRNLFDLSLLMMKIDLYAFGGGLASLPLMLTEVVNVRGWMDSNTFMDGIALGQATPGPIVITAAFVGNMPYGLTGALAATVAIFTPSFLLVVAGDLFFGRLKKFRHFEGVTRGILISFVGFFST
jgi:chromate transporter